MKRLTGKVLLAAACALLVGQAAWADGEFSILEQLRPTQVKRGSGGNVRLFVPRAESTTNDDFFANRRSGSRDDRFSSNSSENNEPTERCLVVTGAISRRGAASMGYLNFSLQFARTFDFRGKALKCKFANLSGNRPEMVIVRLFKKGSKVPLWAIQIADPAFSEESEITFDPNASGSGVKAVVGKGQANDIDRIEFFFGNSENTRHNFRITAIDIVPGSAPEDGGDMGGDNQMAVNGSLMTRAIRDRLAGDHGQVGFFENGDQSFIRVRGIPEAVEGLEGAWLNFRIEFPRPVRLSGKRLEFRCEGLGGIDKLAVRGWTEGGEKPVWSVVSADKAFSAASEEPSMEPAPARPAEFRLSRDDPKNLTIPEDARLDTAVRALEFLVSASKAAPGQEVRAEIIRLELIAE